MKVLFICDEYYPLPQAAAACARNILLDLVEHQGVQCDVLNMSEDGGTKVTAESINNNFHRYTPSLLNTAYFSYFIDFL